MNPESPKPRWLERLPPPQTVIVIVLFVLVLLVVVLGAITIITGSESVHDYLQNVSIVTAGFGIGAGGASVGRRHNGNGSDHAP